MRFCWASVTHLKGIEAFGQRVFLTELQDDLDDTADPRHGTLDVRLACIAELHDDPDDTYFLLLHFIVLGGHRP
jgi:hypothetical protein